MCIFIVYQCRFLHFAKKSIVLLYVLPYAGLFFVYLQAEISLDSLEGLESLEHLVNLEPLDNLDHPPKNSISHLKYLRNEKPFYASIPAQANQLEESVVLSKG